MHAAAQQTWHDAQNHLRATVDAQAYDLWLAPIRAVTRDQSKLVLEVANSFAQSWLKDNYSGVVKEAVARASGRQLEIQFEVGCAESVALVSKAHTAQVEKPRVRPDLTSGPSESAFNPTNNFESFVVGSNNNFAHAAALAVAESPGKAYNPLFVHGGVGLGKTHLLHAIGHRVLDQRKNARVAYISSEKFTNEYIEGIQNNNLGRFRNR